MASLDLTSFEAVLKQHYTSDKVMNLTYTDHPFLAMLAKYTNFGGKNLPIPIQYGNPQGRSATFSNAQNNKTPGKYTDFVLTRVSDYGLASIDNETLEASVGNPNAFMEAATSEIDGALGAVSDSLSTSLFRDSSGYLAQVNAEPSEAASTVVTLKNEGDIVGIEVGQVLNIWSAKSGGTQRSIDGSTVNLTVASVDRDAGTFTVSTAYDASGTIAADDYIFVQGDRGEKLSGLEAWIPDTAPTSGDSFFAVDRSIDPSRLAGQRIDGAGLSREQAVINSASRIAREGGKPDVCFMSFADYAALEVELGSKVQYVDVKTAIEIGFRGIMVNGPRGMVKCIPDGSCPVGKAYMLQMNMWKLYSIKEAPRILTSGDGLKVLRESNADAVEVRTGYYGQLGCRAPGFNGVILNFGA